MSMLLFLGLVALATYVLWALEQNVTILKILLEAIREHLEWHRREAKR